MEKRVNRRDALGLALSAPAAGLAATLAAPAAAAGGTPLYSSPGYCGFPGQPQSIIGVLIALVNDPLAPARLEFVDTTGNARMAYNLTGPTAFFDMSITDGTSNTLVVREWATGAYRRVSVAPPVMPILLPAVQRDGRPVGMRAGSVQVPGGPSRGYLLPFIEQDNIVGAVPGHGGSFAGPVTCPDGQTYVFGLQLPIMRRVQQPPRFLCYNRNGQKILDSPLPTLETRRMGVGISALMADGSVRFVRRLSTGAVLEYPAAPAPDGILIGLLLPAVQGDGRLVGLVGGSAWLAGDGSVAPVPFTPAAALLP